MTTFTEERPVKANRTFSLIITSALLSPAMSPTGASAQSAEEQGLALAKKLDQANEGWKSESSEMEMDLINAQGDVVKRKMAIQVLEGTSDGDKSVASFSWPADVKGTRLLTWTHKKGDDDQWLYLPAIKRTKRISARNKSGSFMGSEFAYEDMSSQEVEKYSYKLLGEEKVDGRDTWKLERVPVDKRSGYTRQVVWNDKEYMNPLKIEYFDRKDELLKVGTFTGYTKHGKLWRVGKIEMVNVQTKKKSILVWSDRKLGEALDEDEFESDALED